MSSILKCVESICVLQGIKFIFDNDYVYLGTLVVTYDVSNSIGDNWD